MKKRYLIIAFVLIALLVTSCVGDPLITSTVIDGSTSTSLNGLLYGNGVNLSALTPSVGSLAVGQAGPQWGVLPVGSAGKVLTSDGTNVAWETVPTAGTLTYYFTPTDSDISNVSAIVATDKQMTSAPFAAKTAIDIANNTTADVVLQTFATNAGIPNLAYIPAGSYEFHIHAYRLSGARNVSLYGVFREVQADGTNVGTIGTVTESTPNLGGSEAEYRLFMVTANTYTLASTTSRIVLDVHAVFDIGAATTVRMYVGGTADSHIALPSATVDATNFVPYTGATNDVNLGTKGLTAASISAPTGRSATYVIAASDAPAHVKAQADSVASGTADDVTINAIIALTGCSAITSATASPLPATVKLIGNFTIAATITVPSYLTLDLTDARITLANGSNCDMITVTSGYYAAAGISYRARILGGFLEGNGGNQTSGYGVRFRAYRGILNGTLIQNCFSGGVAVDPGSSPNSFENSLTDLRIYNWYGSGNGVLFMANATDNLVANCILGKTTNTSNQGYGIYVAASGNAFIGNHFYGGYCGLYVKDKTSTIISGNYFNGVKSSGGYDLLLQSTSTYYVTNIAVTGNIFWGGTDTYTANIYAFAASAGYVTGLTITGNTFNAVNVTNALKLSNTHALAVTGNDFTNAGASPVSLVNANTSLIMRNNTKYIAPGEMQTYSGSIATLTENAFNSVDNPFGQAVRVLSLDVYVSTGATATTPNLDCGIGSSATTDYVTLFDDLPGETVGCYTSTIATPGTQTVPQLWASGSGNRYLNMSIKDAAATGMVATYTVTVMGN